MDLWEYRDPAEIGKGDWVHVHPSRVGSRADSCTDSLEEVVAGGVNAVDRRAFRESELQAKEVAPGLAHRAAVMARKVRYQTKADTVRVLMNHHFTVERPIGEVAVLACAKKHADHCGRAVFESVAV